MIEVRKYNMSFLGKKISFIAPRTSKNRKNEMEIFHAVVNYYAEHLLTDSDKATLGILGSPRYLNELEANEENKTEELPPKTIKCSCGVAMISFLRDDDLLDPIKKKEKEEEPFDAKEDAKASEKQGVIATEEPCAAKKARPEAELVSVVRANKASASND